MCVCVAPSHQSPVCMPASKHTPLLLSVWTADITSAPELNVAFNDFDGEKLPRHLQNGRFEIVLKHTPHVHEVPRLALALTKPFSTAKWKMRQQEKLDLACLAEAGAADARNK